jgi:hypothetical protein
VPQLLAWGYLLLEVCVTHVGRAAFHLVSVAMAIAPFAVAQDDSRGYEAKARFLTNAPAFVEWPEQTFKSTSSPLQICVHGDFRFGTTLAELIRGRVMNGHRMEVKWVKNEQELPSCQVLFVSRSAAKRYNEVLEAVKASITLTIGEDPEFLKAGGMVTLQPIQGGLSFDINLDVVLDDHLRLSSQLLGLARQIVHRTEVAKS